jgi:hypothetical protein
VGREWWTKCTGRVLSRLFCVGLLLGGCSSSADLEVLNRVVDPSGKNDAILALRPGWAGNVGSYIICIVPHGAKPSEDDSALVMRGFELVGTGDNLRDVLKFLSPSKLRIKLKEGKISSFRNYIFLTGGEAMSIKLDVSQ